MKCDNLTQVIQHMYPDAVPNVDFRVMYENGESTITQWNLNYQQPTQTDCDNFSELSAFNDAVQRRITLLRRKCNEAIQGGFTSSASGTLHTYPSVLEAQVMWNATIHRFNLDPTFTNVNQLTLDAGYIPHTKEQFIQAFNDGHDYGLQQDVHLQELIAILNGLSYPTNTIADVYKINWDL